MNLAHWIERAKRQHSSVANIAQKYCFELLRDVLTVNLFTNPPQFQHRRRAAGDDRQAE